MDKKLLRTLPDGKFQNVSTSHSRRMSSIRSKGNRSTELRARAVLVRLGLRGWRVHPKGMPGKPDFYFPDSRVVLFVDGCYWHGCPMCSHARGVNHAYWTAKIQGNRARDRANTLELEQAGYRVLRAWEHDLKLGSRGRWIESLRSLIQAAAHAEPSS